MGEVARRGSGTRGEGSARGLAERGDGRESDAAASWDWSAEEIRRVGAAAVELIVRHCAELPARSVFRPYPGDAQARRTSAPPERGVPMEEVLAEFAAEIEPYPFGNGHPRFFGWVNSPPDPVGVFAAALAAAMNPSVAGGNHAATWIEREVVGWFRQLLGMPDGAGGLLVSGSSAAALSALAAARQAALAARGWDGRARGLAGAPPLTVYQTREAHSCHQRAVELLGLGAENLRLVGHDAALRMLPAELDRALAADLAAGCAPMAVVASAGTVNTGAVDPLEAIAEICARRGVWLHGDAAYGGAAILAPACARDLGGLAKCDSVAVDAHKWLHAPVDAGALLVRDPSALRAAFSLVPPYLRTDGDPEGVGGPPWFSEFGPEQTRAFRALKVWMGFKRHGLAGYRAGIARTLRLAEHLAARVRAEPALELREPRGLSIVCFRCRFRCEREAGRWEAGGDRAGDEAGREAGDEAGRNACNQELLRRLQLGGKSFLSSTVVDGVFWLRACIVNFRSREEDLDALIEDVLARGRELAGAARPRAAV